MGQCLRDRQAVMNSYLRWNSPREDQRIKWKEVEARLMGNEGLRWRRGLITEIVTKAESNHLLSQSQRIQNFGSGSTVFMQATVSTRGLEQTLSHTKTKVSTSTKLAARKVRGGRVRGMLVLAHNYEYSKVAEDGQSAETPSSTVSRVFHC